MKVTAVVPSYEPDEKLIQVVDGLLRAVGVDLDERIDVVERIEQKMGVELAFEVLQFGLRAAVFQLLPGRFGLVPAARHADGDSRTYHQQVERGVSGEKTHGVLPRPRQGRVLRIGRQHVAEQEVQPDDHRGDQQRVAAQETACLTGEEVSFDQQEIVRVEDHHERERYEQEAQVLRTGHQRPVGGGDEQRHPEDHGPCRQVDQPARIFRLQSGHSRTKLTIISDYS